jgi:hypothetical protein
MIKPALIGGVLIGILSAVPLLNMLNCLCCAWVIGGGIFASYLYVKDAPFPVTLGGGVALGLLTGVIGAVVDTIFSIPLYFAMSGMGGFAEQLSELLDRVPNLDPEARRMFLSLVSESGGAAVFTISVLMQLVIFALVAMLGGAIGVAIFEKRKPGNGTPTHYPTTQPQGDPPPPPPPINVP